MSIKRLHYFNGQFLKEQDFTDEQKYHLEMRRRLSQRLHAPGIVFGLDVIPGANKVTVQPGMAIDVQGREVVLDTATDLTITAAADITIAYNEEQTDESSETGIVGKRRWTESAVLANAADPDGIVLAKVATVSPVALNAAFRRPYASPVVLGDLEVGRNLTIQGNLTVQGETTTVQTERMRGNVVLGDEDVDTITVEGRLLTGHSSGRLQIGSPVQVSGEVALGGPLTLPGNPTAALQAATKQYIDTHTGAANPHSGSLAKTGDTMSGALSITAPGTGLSVTNNAFVGGSVGLGTATPDRKLTVVEAGATTDVFANLKNDTHEILMGVDNAAIVSAMTNSDLQLRTNNATRVVVKANTGNVGIGTLNPTRIVQTQTGINQYSYSQTDGAIELATFLNGSFQSGMIGTVSNHRFQIYTSNSGPVLTCTPGGTAAGSVGVGTPTPSDKLDVAGALRILTGSNPIRFTSAWSSFPDAVLNQAEICNDTGGFKTLMIVGNKSAGVGRRVSVWDVLEVNGNLNVTGAATKPGGGSWASSSDQRLKKNVTALKAGVLDRLLKLRGVSYEWKEPEKFGNQMGAQIGLVADEVEKVFPDWVCVDAQGYKTLTIRGFEALTIEALREVRQANEDLRNANRELQQRLKALEKKLAHD